MFGNEKVKNYNSLNHFLFFVLQADSSSSFKVATTYYIRYKT